MDARPTRTSRYERQVDNIFGRVESFKLVHEHRVQVKIGNSYFNSSKTYPTAESALRAARRLQPARVTIEEISE